MLKRFIFFQVVFFSIWATSIEKVEEPRLEVADLHYGNLETNTYYDGIDLNVTFDGDFSELICEWGDEMDQITDDLNPACSCADGACLVNFHTTLSEISYRYPITISHVQQSLQAQMIFSFNVDDASFGGGDTVGCTDPNAINYNPHANIDDGSCEYN